MESVCLATILGKFKDYAETFGRSDSLDATAELIYLSATPIVLAYVQSLEKQNQPLPPKIQTSEMETRKDRAPTVSTLTLALVKRVPSRRSPQPSSHKEGRRTDA